MTPLAILGATWYWGGHLPFPGFSPDFYVLKEILWNWSSEINQLLIDQNVFI